MNNNFLLHPPHLKYSFALLRYYLIKSKSTMRKSAITILLFVAANLSAQNPIESRLIETNYSCEDVSLNASRLFENFIVLEQFVRLCKGRKYCWPLKRGATQILYWGRTLYLVLLYSKTGWKVRKIIVFMLTITAF
jgi:hypothetical protein